VPALSSGKDQGFELLVIPPVALPFNQKRIEMSILLLILIVMDPGSWAGMTTR